MKNKNSKLNIFIGSDKDHNIFIFPHIFFALKQEPEAIIEVFSDKSAELNNSKCLSVLKEIFPDQIFIREKIYKNLPAQFSRFIEEPQIKCDYTYIGDVDILITEPLLDFHLNKMHRRKICFDNEVRMHGLHGSKRLSGLHFVKTREYYEKTKKARDISVLNNSNDEVMLYDIIKSSFGNPVIYMYINENYKSFLRTSFYYLLSLINFRNYLNWLTKNTRSNFVRNRPYHGIHLSLNRLPYKRNKKNMFWFIQSDKEREVYIKNIKSKEWKRLEPYLPAEFLKIKKIFESYLNI